MMHQDIRLAIRKLGDELAQASLYVNMVAAKVGLDDITPTTLRQWEEARQGVEQTVDLLPYITGALRRLAR